MGDTLSVPLKQKYREKIFFYFGGKLKVPHMLYPLQVSKKGGYSPSRDDLICFHFNGLCFQGHHFVTTLCRMLALHFGKRKTFTDINNCKFQLPYFFYDTDIFPVPHRPIIKNKVFTLILNKEKENFNVSDINGYVSLNEYPLFLFKKKYNKQNKDLLEEIIQDLK